MSGRTGVDLTYPAKHLGDGPAAMGRLRRDAEGRAEADDHPRPRRAARPDGAAVLAAAWALAAEVGALTPDWHGFNLLHLFGGQVGALELGFVPGQGGKDLAAMLGGGVDALWLLNADGFDPARIADGTFVVYQGHHGDAMPRAGGRDPAGCGLHREGRDLGEHRGARAARAPGHPCARRGARGLAHHPRLQRGRRQDAALQTPRSAPRAPGRGEPGLRAHRRGRRAGCADTTGPAATGAPDARPSCCRSRSITRQM
jgi:NADH-quinone oxidoreductase subunit G